jgi:histidine triad (HIT) family protein
MSENCIFCRIVEGDIPSDKVYEDEHFIAIRDVNPQAPIHILVIPKTHVANILEASGDERMMAGIFKAVNRVAEKLNMKVDGLRIVSNVGRFGCQSVPHLHIHVLGGAQLGDKMA